jgi:diguanylate cyclase
MSLGIRDIRVRLWVAAALPALLVVAVLLAGFIDRHRTALGLILQDRAQSTAMQLGAMAEFHLFAGDRTGLQRLVEAVQTGDGQILAAGILSADGQVYALAGRLSGPLQVRPDGARVSVDEQYLTVIAPIAMTTLAGPDLFAAGASSEPPQRSPELLGYAVVRLTRAVLLEQQRKTVQWALLTTLGVLLLAGFLSVWIASGVTRPIGEISQTVARIREGDMTARVDEKQAGVLEVLATGINEMALRVALTQEHLQQQVELATEELRRQKEAAERLARVDHLTGTASRGAFMEVATAEVQRALRYNQPMSMVVIDLDHFKAINDTHGHATGDAVLLHFARTIEAEIREVDLIGRLGGEEFAVLLPNIAAGEAVQVAERMRQAVSASRLEAGGRQLRYSASFGVAQFDPRELTLASLLSRADTALYDAKRRGRDRVELAA